MTVTVAVPAAVNQALLLLVHAPGVVEPAAVAAQRLSTPQTTLVAPLLTFRIGGGHAANLLLTARLIEAAEAYRIGLYHELTASETIWARAHALAQECAKSAPQSLQLTKRMLNETIGDPLATLLSAGAAATATARTTEAATEGLAAFLEKREPKWP